VVGKGAGDDAGLEASAAFIGTVTELTIQSYGKTAVGSVTFGGNPVSFGGNTNVIF
jgi:hypothetical protein